MAVTGVVTRYTFRYFTGDDVVSVMHIDVDGDADAVQLAEDCRFGFDVEVWEELRFVCRTHCEAEDQRK